jgi:hypothetical protein
MSFAFPIALTLAAIALPIIALYILKVRLRRVPVSTNLFWKQIYHEKPPRSLWQHFRHLSSLLLQLAMLLLLVLSIADPHFSTQLLQSRRLVIVIDNSASMRATDVVPSRLDAAKAAAQEIINGLRFRDEVAVVLAGTIPEVVVGMTGHAPTLRHAIRDIPASDKPTSLHPAIELGLQLIGQHPHGQVIVMTDGAAEPADLPVTRRESDSSVTSNTSASDRGSAAELQDTVDTAEASFEVAGEKLPVEFRLFSTEAANAGITQLQVRRSFADPLGYEILVVVRNASAVAVTCRLEVSLNDVPVDVIPLTLAAEERWSRSIEKTSLDGGRVHVQLTQIKAVNADGPESAVLAGASPDLLSTDNAAWALLPARKIQPVLLVSSGNLFLQKVFEANPLVELTIRKDLPDEWPADSLVVLHGAVPATLPPNDLFVVDPIGSCDQWDEGEVIRNPIVTDQDGTSPLMNYIRLDNIVLPELKLLNFRAPVHALAKSLSGELVYAEVRRPVGKCLVLAVNLDESDLAFRTVFPIMVANSLSWFAGTSGELQPALSTGSISAVEVYEISGPTPGEIILQSPDGKKRSIANSVPSSGLSANVSPFEGEKKPLDAGTSTATNSAERIAIGPLDEAGIWFVTQKSSDTTRDRPLDEDAQTQILAEVAVNLASERETDLRPLPQLTASPQTKSVSPAWFSRPLWFYLTLMACGLTSIEWFLYQRRLIS